MHSLGMERHHTNDLSKSQKSFRSTIEKTRFFRGLLKTIGVLAVSMVMADGVLTPAQSVLGAVQGLNVVKPDISKSTIVGVTCAILILLFVLQPLGISKLTVVFSPIVMIWLAFNAGFGIYNLARLVNCKLTLKDIANTTQIRLYGSQRLQSLLRVRLFDKE